MCGICVLLAFKPCDSANEECSNLISEECMSYLKNRGPDCFDAMCIKQENCADVTLCASVLHLRGKEIISQPIKDEKSNILLWNGEIFGGPLFTGYDESDSKVVSNALSKCNDENEIIHIFGKIEGPFAFIYFQATRGLLWFGRDIFGRRSLLVNAGSTPCLSFNLSSVAVNNLLWKEVPCDGIYCLNVQESLTQNELIITKYTWTKSASGQLISICNSISDHFPDVKLLTDKLAISPSIQFILNRDLPSAELCLEVIMPNVGENIILKEILSIPSKYSVIIDFENVLCAAIQRRLVTQPFLCKLCYGKKEVKEKYLHTNTRCEHSSVGILFSGGIDSIVIAALADRYIPVEVSIDLINVAFEMQKNSAPKKKKDISNQDMKQISYETPDRITGHNGFAELQEMNPKRKWNFVEVNVSRAELEEKRFQHIKNLIIPSCTVLDDSIGCALWFAARGVGTICCNGHIYPYCSPSRVLLVGMGADEQLAGYSRHRVKFSMKGWSGLVDELSMELDRIGSRNLGRDDRIISDHGRETRFPFLDENVVSFLNKTPIWLKANFKYPRGLGDKLLLRLLAFKIGLKSACTLPKRAIQFGSRIARCENNQEKGSDLCERLAVDVNIR